MRTIHSLLCLVLCPLAVATLATSCAHLPTTVKRTAVVSHCVITDARLGTIIVDPKVAQAYLRGLAAEARAILEARKANPTSADITRERQLVADVLDLIDRLMTCIESGAKIDSASLEAVEEQLAELRAKNSRVQTASAMHARPRL